MRANRMLLLAGVATVALLAMRWLQPYPMPVAQTVLPPELPTRIMKADTNLLSMLINHNLWDKNRGELSGGTSTNSADEETNAAEENAGLVASWQLLGVSQQGKQPLAVVSGGDEIKSYQPGEQLPDGAKLIKIMPYGIQVKKSGKNESVYLFGKK